MAVNLIYKMKCLIPLLTSIIFIGIILSISNDSKLQLEYAALNTHAEDLDNRKNKHKKNNKASFKKKTINISRKYSGILFSQEDPPDEETQNSTDNTKYRLQLKPNLSVCLLNPTNNNALQIHDKTDGTNNIEVNSFDVHKTIYENAYETNSSNTVKTNNTDNTDKACPSFYFNLASNVLKCSIAFLAGAILSDMRFIKFGVI